MHFGYVCENGVTYNYRRRNNGSSNVDAITSGANKEALLAPIYIFEDLYPKEGYLAPYEKELLAYELRSRLRTIKKEKFSEKEYKEILDNYGKWIHRLDDEFIAKSKWLDMIEKKVLFLMLSNRNFGDWVRKGFSDLSDRIIRVHWLSIENSKVRIVSVSYTHLTLPTKRIVEFSVGVVLLKKKKRVEREGALSSVYVDS